MTRSYHFKCLGLMGLGCLGGILLGLQVLPKLAATPNPGVVVGEIMPSALAAEPSSVDEQLLSAIRAYDAEAAKVALDEGANPNAGDFYNGYALTIAAGLGNEEIVQLLVENGADVNIFVDEGYTALAEAVNGGHYQVVAYLLDLGVNPNQLVSGVTPIFFAAQSGRPDIVELLLQYGADPNYQSHSSILGETRRSQQETQQAYDEVIRLLTEAGAQ